MDSKKEKKAVETEKLASEQGGFPSSKDKNQTDEENTSVSEDSKGKSKVKKKKSQNKVLQEKVKELQEGLDKEKDRFLRIFAEYENFRKRTSKEKLELYKSANKQLIIDLLSVVDDYERASFDEEKGSIKDTIEGFGLIQKKFYQILESNGLSLIEVNKGDLFDGDHHEAIAHIPSGEGETGRIVDITQKGYKLGEIVIRYPKVVVGK
ncbi:MAG: nucleotide exchange factor GrpE [Flavobacteriaceae bacterium]|nr:nucleotide exchange factor GrpE [Flavobacteriaceae bacterium]